MSGGTAQTHFVDLQQSSKPRTLPRSVRVCLCLGECESGVLFFFYVNCDFICFTVQFTSEIKPEVGEGELKLCLGLQNIEFKPGCIYTITCADH